MSLFQVLFYALCIKSFNPFHIPVCMYYYLHITEEETEAGRG